MDNIDVNGTPSPMTYNIRSDNYEKKIANWLLTESKSNLNDSICPCSKDHKMEFQSVRDHHFEKKNGNKNGPSDQNIHLCQKENKENVQNLLPVPKMKNIEGKAPSFMSRPKIVHSCVSSDSEKAENFQRNNFNRYSTKRKSVRVNKKPESNKTIENKDNDLSLMDKTFLSEISAIELVNESLDNTLKSTKEQNNQKQQQIQKEDTFVIDAKDNSTGAISKRNESDLELEKKEITESMSYKNTFPPSELQIEGNINTKVSETEEWVINAKDNLNRKIEKEFFHSSTDDNLSTSIETDEFSMSGNFIDDEYESYLDEFTMGKLQDINGGNLFKICSCLLSSYSSSDGTVDTQDLRCEKVEEKKTEKSLCSKIDKLFGKNKNKALENRLRRELGRIIKNAIAELKGQFKREIYKNTECKLKDLISQIAKLNKDADRSTDYMCDRVSSMLIDKLDKFVKQQ